MLAGDATGSQTGRREVSLLAVVQSEGPPSGLWVDADEDEDLDPKIYLILRTSDDKVTAYLLL